MTRYMSMFKYGKDAYSGTLEEGPVARAKFLRAYTAEQGGEVEAIWYSAGEWDMVAITRHDFDATTLARQWAAMATGAFTDSVVVRVFSPEEFQAGIDDMERTYRKPGG